MEESRCSLASSVRAGATSKSISERLIGLEQGANFLNQSQNDSQLKNLFLTPCSK